MQAEPSHGEEGAANARGIHWVVPLHRRNRSLFFAMLLVMLATHLPIDAAHAGMWALLGMQLLVYPQLVYWRAARAADPLRAEMQNLMFDGVLFGAWAAYWGLPLWISATLLMGLCLNVVVFMGLPGLVRGIAAFALGICVVALARGFAFQPDTDVVTSLLCLLLMLLYQLFVAHGAYERGLQLRENRKRLAEQLQEITALQARLQQQAQRDALTGLYNRRYLDQALERALAECRDAGRPLALALIDIDHFKRINDNHGHPAGDEMIRRVGALLSSRVRDAGLVVGRYGGEEFMLVLPGMTVDGAARLADELRTMLEALRVELDAQVIRATLSIGIAGHPLHETCAQALVREADRALYAAKQGGRNRVVVAPATVSA